MTTLLSRKRSLFGLPTGVQAVVEGRCDERGGAHKKGVPAAERWPKLTWPSQRCFEELLTSPRFLESLLSGAERTTDQQRTLQALVAENGNAVYDALGGAFRTLRAGILAHQREQLWVPNDADPKQRPDFAAIQKSHDDAVWALEARHQAVLREIDAMCPPVGHGQRSPNGANQASR